MECLISVGVEFYFCIALMEKADRPSKMSHSHLSTLSSSSSVPENSLVFKGDGARSTTLNIRQESEKNT